MLSRRSFMAAGAVAVASPVLLGATESSANAATAPSDTYGLSRTFWKAYVGKALSVRTSHGTMKLKVRSVTDLPAPTPKGSESKFFVTFDRLSGAHPEDTLATFTMSGRHSVVLFLARAGERYQAVINRR